MCEAAFQRIDKDSMSWKVLGVISIQFPFILPRTSTKDIVSYSPQRSRPVDIISWSNRKHHRLSIHSIYLDYGLIRIRSIANIPAQGSISFSWCQEHLARALDVFFETNCIHKGRQYHIPWLGMLVYKPRKVTTSRPSIHRWSYVSVTTIIGRTTIRPLTAAGLSLVACMPSTAA